MVCLFLSGCFTRVLLYKPLLKNFPLMISYSGLAARVTYLHEQLTQTKALSTTLASSDPSANTNLLQVDEAISDAMGKIETAKEILDRSFLGGLG